MKIQIWRRYLLSLLPLLLAGLIAANVFADGDDPPARVARLSLAQGKVSFQPSGQTDWSEASINRPVTTGDRIFADQGSRAELEVGPFALRLSQNTDVTVANLNDQLLQLGLGQGSLRVTIYELPANNSLEIDTPNGALLLQATGSYRVDTAADGNSTRVTVNAGSLQISAGDLSQNLQSGQAVKLTGTGPVMASSLAIPPPDDFDQWSGERDQRVENSASVRSVGPSLPGGEDLDVYGQWTDDPRFGAVWYPSNLPPDWAPYRYGHWVYIRPWSWTWVADEPWGYAPFHYGRWVRIHHVWAWVPGPTVARTVYAPALVVFVGGGNPGVHAWFPLGPQEPYAPWYDHGPTYVNRVNVVNVTNVTNIHYVNREEAYTAVSNDTFRGGQPVSRGIIRVSSEQVTRSQPVTPLDVAPTSHAVLGAGAVPPPPVRPTSVMTPSQPGPSGFETTRPAYRVAPRPGGPPNSPPPHVFTRNSPAPTSNPNAPHPENNQPYTQHSYQPANVNNGPPSKPAATAPPPKPAGPKKNPPAPKEEHKSH